MQQTNFNKTFSDYEHPQVITFLQKCILSMVFTIIGYIDIQVIKFSIFCYHKEPSYQIATSEIQQHLVLQLY